MRWLPVAIVIALSCSGNPPHNSSAPVRLVTEPEIARYETELLQQLSANAQLTCERPVLHGKATPGKAAPDLAALDQPAGALAPCVEALSATDMAGGRSAAMLALDQRCGMEYEAAIQKAVSHLDACTPFQAGQRQPASLQPFLGVAKLIALRARLRAEAGDVDGAFELILDGIRFYQDLARGHTSLLLLMVETAATQLLIDVAHDLAAGPNPPTKLDVLAADLDRLLASDPTFTDAVAGTLAGRALYYGLAPLKGPDWNPPGGWPEIDGIGPLHPEIWPVKAGSFASPRDDKAIMLLVEDTLAPATTAACPDRATYRACHAGLEELVSDTAARTRGNDDVAEVFARLSARSTDSAVIRTAIVDVLVRNEAKDLDVYAAKRAEMYARLAALRLHVELLRKKRCPTTAELATAPYWMLSTPIKLGDSLTTTVVNGAIEITPPAWVHSKRPGWRIPCVP